MDACGPEIDAALESDSPIDREEVIAWIENARDLRTLAKLYRLTDQGYFRIHPELGRETTCTLIETYLLRCIRENIENDDEILSRFEAAMTLPGWLRHLLTMDGTQSIINHVAHSVTALFLESGPDIRYTIETGFLEHALETAALRPYFEHWANDPHLRTAWEPAVAWGKAHPDHMARLFNTLDEGGEK